MEFGETKLLIFLLEIIHQISKKVTEKLPTDLNVVVIEQKDKYKLSLRKRMKMAKEAALGVNWLHCSNPMFIHRDIKPSNLLVKET